MRISKVRITDHRPTAGKPSPVVRRTAATTGGSMTGLDYLAAIQKREAVEHDKAVRDYAPHTVEAAWNDLAGRDCWDRKNPDRPSAPFAVNQIVHKTNNRLDEDVALCKKYKVPLVITSLGANPEMNAEIHSWGGVILHDVINDKFARKAIEKGADGLIPVAAGAGGHAGGLSPFALMQELRQWFDGPIALSGAITRGDQVLAAQTMGADLAYMGTRFIATAEANAAERYTAMIVESAAADIVYTPFFTGVPGNYLKPSIAAQGLDPDALPAADKSRMKYGSDHVRPWKDIWGAGQGVGSIADAPPAAEVIARLKAE